VVETDASLSSRADAFRVKSLRGCAVKKSHFINDMCLLKVKVSVSLCQSVRPSFRLGVPEVWSFNHWVFSSNISRFRARWFSAQLLLLLVLLYLINGKEIFFPRLFFPGSKWLRLMQHYVSFHCHA